MITKDAGNLTCVKTHVNLLENMLAILWFELLRVTNQFNLHIQDIHFELKL